VDRWEEGLKNARILWTSFMDGPRRSKYCDADGQARGWSPNYALSKLCVNNALALGNFFNRSN